jgi:hypothetical protein
MSGSGSGLGNGICGGDSGIGSDGTNDGGRVNNGDGRGK